MLRAFCVGARLRFACQHAERFRAEAFGGSTKLPRRQLNRNRLLQHQGRGFRRFVLRKNVDRCAARPVRPQLHKTIVPALVAFDPHGKQFFLQQLRFHTLCYGSDVRCAAQYLQ